MRFYMVDRITEICPEKYIEGTKLVSMSEDVFNEHFPGYPVFPGSLIMEGLAQISGLLFEYTIREKKLLPKRAALTMVNRMKYKQMVIPGDCICLRADVKVFYPNEYAVATVTAKVNGKICAVGELMFCFLDIMDDDMKKVTDKLMKLAFMHAKTVPNEEYL